MLRESTQQEHTHVHKLQGQQYSEQQDDSSAANDPQGQEREDA